MKNKPKKITVPFAHTNCSGTDVEEGLVEFVAQELARDLDHEFMKPKYPIPDLNMSAEAKHIWLKLCQHMATKTDALLLLNIWTDLNQEHKDAMVSAALMLDTEERQRLANNLVWRDQLVKTGNPNWPLFW